MYTLVIDEGTTGTRALIFDQDFEVASQSYQEFTQYTPKENMVEHDAEEIYQKSVDVCQKALEKANLSAKDIRSIGITNQRNTCLVWDKKTGKPLYPAIVWQDTRTGGAAEKIKETKWGDKILQSTGKTIAPHNNGLILKWLLDNVPEVKEKVEKNEAIYGTMDTWLIWKLTNGQTHAVSYSNASSSGCFDLHKSTWDEELLDYLGVPLSIFPAIKSESADYGTTNVFDAPIKITGVIADQQSALFAQGCLDPGTMKCTNGTGSFMDINVGTEVNVVPGGVDNLVAWNLDGKITYMVEGFVSVTGSAVQWLRDGMKMFEKSDDIEALAASVPDTNGVYFVPALVGLTTPHNDPFARGMIIGLTRGATNAHVARATLECIAFGIKDILDVVEKGCNVKIEEIKVDGGASEDDLLVQMLADYCDAKVVRPNTLQATSLGAALMASLYVGAIDLEDVKTVLRSDSVFVPEIDPEVRDERYSMWQEAVRRSLNWIKK